MVIEGSLPSAQLSLFVSGLLIVAGGRSTLSPNSLLLLLNLLGVPLGLLRVLLSEGALLVCLAPMRIDRLPQLLSLSRMSVGLLTVSRCFGSKPLSQNPLSLRPAADICDGSGECEYDYGDNENR